MNLTVTIYNIDYPTIVQNYKSLILEKLLTTSFLKRLLGSAVEFFPKTVGGIIRKNEQKILEIVTGKASDITSSINSYLFNQFSVRVFFSNLQVFHNDVGGESMLNFCVSIYDIDFKSFIPLLRQRVIQDNMNSSLNLLIKNICKMINALSDVDFEKMLDALSVEEKEDLIICLLKQNNELIKTKIQAVLMNNGLPLKINAFELSKK